MTEAKKKQQKIHAAKAVRPRPAIKAHKKEAKAVVFESASVSSAPAPEKSLSGKLNYYFAVGRRKESVAQVRLFKNGSGEIKINNKDFKQYFPWAEWQNTVTAPLKTVGQADKLNVEVKVAGGGVRGQADAVRHGISRALLQFNPVFRRGLKKVGFLTRDPRVKERKKYGLKRARRGPQWAKR